MLAIAQVVEALTEMNIGCSTDGIVDAKLHIDIKLAEAAQAAILIHGPCDFVQNNQEVSHGVVVLSASRLTIWNSWLPV